VESITIVIADHHPFLRLGIRTMLGTAPDLVLVGEAGTGPEAVRLAADLQPDVVVLSIRLPGINGIDAIAHIRAGSTHSRIIILTEYDDGIFIDAALEAGARGYLLKDAQPEELVRAIGAVHRGERFFSTRIAAQAVAYLAKRREAVSR
jgi:DNA-binding NarL/FixJ family response regulator